MVFFGDGAYLVGPNNAGKSTILTALRTADVLLRLAHRRKPEIGATDHGMNVVGYPVILRDFPALRDSLRHEFGGDEARLELQWKSGAKLVAVWPAEDSDDPDQSGFFYLLDGAGYQVKSPPQAKTVFPALGVIPILGPTEHAEKLLDPGYVRQNVSGRLSSRHFRNQLRLLKEQKELDGFLTWASAWLGDIRFDRLGQHFADEGMLVEAFFYEGQSRVPKEIVWAGDGIQVWLQLLYHVHRVKDRQTIIVDEPEVYLHPDLQRRLVQLLESTGQQVIVATHSAEMLAESDGRLTVLVDRSRRRASRPRTNEELATLSSMLGTAFNLRLAKALRSKVAVFVEGTDMKVLREFAKTLGLDHIATENGITVIPLNGYSGWENVAPFKWLCGELLPDALQTFVVLDRDYRTDSDRQDTIDELGAAGVSGHVWSRKELESYLLNEATISRLSGIKESTVSDWIDDITATMEVDVFAKLLGEELKARGGIDPTTVTARFKPRFDAAWSDSTYRRSVCPPKKILSGLNSRLHGAGKKTLSPTSLARAHIKTEIPREAAELLQAIEARVVATAR